MPLDECSVWGCHETATQIAEGTDFDGDQHVEYVQHVCARHGGDLKGGGATLRPASQEARDAA